MREVEVRTTALERSELSQVMGCVSDAAAVDTTPPLSDQTLLRVAHPDADSAPGIHLLAYRHRSIVGYGFATRGEAELVVHPKHRRTGHGRALLATAIGHAPRREGQLRLWAHGDHPGAVRLTAEFGLARDRILWRMERPLHGADIAATLAASQLPESVRLRSFVPGQDEAAWLRLNRRAFAGHSEQADWELSDLKLRETEPWFDAEGFLLAERAADNVLLGAHWTKIHAATATKEPVGSSIGEVYVLSVDPDEHGGGLGRALLAAGLGHLQRRGLRRAMLYTDATNTVAARLYEKGGFSHAGTDVQYLSAAQSPPAGVVSQLK